jgi:hypothetical protein
MRKETYYIGLVSKRLEYTKHNKNIVTYFMQVEVSILVRAI